MGGTVSTDTFTTITFTVAAETWTVDPFVFVVNNTGRAFRSNVSQSTLINNGFIFGSPATGAIDDGAVSLSGTQASVTNNTGGVIKGIGTGVSGILIEQGGAIANHGTILGTKDGIHTASGATITNTGSISGGVAAIESRGQTTLTNQGSITGNIIVAATESSNVTNAGGTINGDLSFAHGTNLFDGRGGTITGAVHGGDGADTLIGGKGADELFGGLGADTFKFVVKAEIGKGAAADTIEDFSAVGLDIIDLTALDASTKAKGNQAFHYIGSQHFHHKAGELSFSNHILSGDINGDGKPDFQINVLNVDTLRAGIDIHL